MTRNLLCAALVVAALLMLSAQSIRAEVATNGAPAAKKKLLVVSHTNGFRHSSIPIGNETLRILAERSGDFSVAYCETQEDVTRMLTLEYLRDFDGVFFNNTTGNLGIPDLHAFLDWIGEGKAFIGAHSATDTYHPHDTNGDRSFIDMLGGEFRTHGAQCEVAAIVEDATHPCCAHLAPIYTIFDEIYLFKENTRPQVHMLLSLDKHPNDGAPEAGQPGDYQLAWCKYHGQGRVFYTALGHREDVWESEPYRQHLLGGIRWALGLAEGNPPAPMK